MVNSEQNDLLEETTKLFATDWYNQSSEQTKLGVNKENLLTSSLPIYSLNPSGSRFTPSTTTDSLPSIEEISSELAASAVGNNDFQIQIRSRHSSAAGFDAFHSAWPSSGAFPPVGTASDAPKQRHSSYSDHSLVTMAMTPSTRGNESVFSMQPIGGEFNGSGLTSSARSRAYSEGSLNMLTLDGTTNQPTAAINATNPATAASYWPLATGVQPRPSTLGQYRNSTSSAGPQVCAGQFMNQRAATTAAAAAAAVAAAAAAQQQAQAGSRYKTELCRPFEESGRCKYGEKCQFAHGHHELREMQRHPKYKTELCRTYHTSGYCPYGPRCHFIHEKPRDSASTAKAQPALTQVINSTTPSPTDVPAPLMSSLNIASLQDELTSKARLFSVPRPVPLTNSNNNCYYNSVAASPSSSYSPPGFECLMQSPRWGNGSPPFGSSASSSSTTQQQFGDDHVFMSPPRSPAAVTTQACKETSRFALNKALASAGATTGSGEPATNRLSVFRSLSKTE